jgi:hypothetical protein
MPELTSRKIRVVAGLALLVYLSCVVNYFFDLHWFGRYDESVLTLATFGMVMLVTALRRHMPMLQAVGRLRAVAGICAVGCVLLVSLVLPYLSFALERVAPTAVVNLLFFFPQYLFNFRYVVKPVTGGFDALFTRGGALLFGVLLWGSVALSYGVVSQRFGKVSLWLIAPAVVVGVTILVHVLFGLFGYGLELDGP